MLGLSKTNIHSFLCTFTFIQQAITIYRKKLYLNLFYIFIGNIYIITTNNQFKIRTKTNSVLHKKIIPIDFGCKK